MLSSIKPAIKSVTNNLIISRINKINNPTEIYVLPVEGQAILLKIAAMVTVQSGKYANSMEPILPTPLLNVRYFKIKTKIKIVTHVIDAKIKGYVSMIPTLLFLLL
jgi:hypothetical protein